MPLLSNIMANLRQFLADDRGAAGIEFLCTLPLLIGTMVLTAEYGNALRTKMVLNTATADVTRFLARTPLQEDPANPGGLSFYNNFLIDAQAILDARMGGNVTFGAAVFEVEPDATLRSTPIMVRVTTDIGLTMPLLGFINQTVSWANQFTLVSPPGKTQVVETFISLASRQDAIWTGGSDIGAADCTLIDHGLNEPCGTSTAGAPGS